MVQFLSIIFFLGFLQFLLGFSKVPVFLCHPIEGCTGRHDVMTKGLHLPTEQPTHRGLFRKHPNTIMYQLATVCADVTNVCMKWTARQTKGANMEVRFAHCIVQVDVVHLADVWLQRWRSAVWCFCAQLFATSTVNYERNL